MLAVLYTIVVIVCTLQLCTSGRVL